MLVEWTPEAVATLTCSEWESELAVKKGVESMCSRPADMPWTRRIRGPCDRDSGTKNMVIRTVARAHISEGISAGSCDQKALGCLVPGE